MPTSNFVTVGYLNSEATKIKTWATDTFVSDVLVDGTSVVDSEGKAKFNLSHLATKAELTSEGSRAILIENELRNLITSEGLRATAAEASLSTSLSSLETRVDTIEISLPTTGEIATKEYVDSEAVILKGYTDWCINSEAVLARANEAALNTLILNESSRATSEEARLETKIDANSLLINGLQIQITSEDVRITNLENKFGNFATIDYVDSESARAIVAELLLEAEITSEGLRIDNLDLTKQDKFVTTGKYLEFNSEGTKLHCPLSFEYDPATGVLNIWDNK